MVDELGHFWRYFRAHHGIRLITALIALTLAEGTLRAWFMTLPAATPNGLTMVPFRHFLPILVTAFVVGGLHSSMRSMELAYTEGMARFQVGFLIAATMIAMLCMGGMEAALGSASSALVLIRGILIWLGMALVSGRLFGWHLNWLLPTFTIFPIVYYGLGRSGNMQWWNWIAQPSGYATSWAMAAVSMALGAMAYRLTPWRMRQLKMFLLVRSVSRGGGRWVAGRGRRVRGVRAR